MRAQRSASASARRSPGPRTAASLAVSASLCGALALGVMGTAPAMAAAPAATGDSSVAGRPSMPRTARDMESLLAAIDELMNSPLTAINIVDEDKLDQVMTEADGLLAEAPPGQRPGDWPAGTARIALKKEVDRLVNAAGEGDWLAAGISQAAVPKLVTDLLSAVGLDEYIDKMPTLPDPADPTGPTTPTAPATTPQTPQTPQTPTVPPALPAWPATPTPPSTPAWPSLPATPPAWPSLPATPPPAWPGLPPAPPAFPPAFPGLH
ncbi:hypothetical protein [Streptomyces sp. NBC_01304]|uniref:hypothetical protein n=1 Tax=Streptomyces sp. NBC_01304 TaxID=2903818 RepID=UPI002E0FDF70|nr:hypothetical protein OG430_16670 [Streptomyces sp. NBC_01304]